MNITLPIALGGLVGFAGLFLSMMLLLGGARVSGPQPVLARLEDKYLVTTAGDGDVARPAAKDAFRAALQARFGSKVEGTQRGGQLATRLAFAELALRPAEWILIAIGCGVLGSGLLTLRFQSLIAAPVGLVLGYGGAEFFLKMRISRRRKRFEKLLGPTMLSLSNGVKAGYSFPQAIDLVSKNAVAPMGPELQRVVRSVQLGVSVNEALGQMVERNQSEDLKLLLTAVQIQAQVGGNLAEILDIIEFTIRERVRIKGEVRTLTGQARASGWVLIILPFALAGILQLVAPSYFGPMLSETMGFIMIGVAGFSLTCGYAIIRKIVNIEI